MSMIINIQKIDELFKPNDEEEKIVAEFCGYKLETTSATHYFLMDNNQDCCEEWGYITTEDNLDEFIGAELLEITKTTTDEFIKKLTTKMKHVTDELHREHEERGSQVGLGLVGGSSWMDGEDVAFTTIKTNRGDFQFVAYTLHNGYYGHAVTYKKIVKGE